MKYKEWNKAIAEYFFNESKSEKEVYLYITKQDIIRIGKNSGLDLDEKQIFEDYINALIIDSKYESGYSIINRPLALYKAWHITEDEERKNNYPPYIAYLVAYILPLTIPGKDEYNYNNYYGRLNDYFHKYGLLPTNKEINTNTFRKLDNLWKDLEIWTWEDKNFEVGIFHLHPFSNEDWVHVGKPLSQAIFPVSAINKLHDFYDFLNWVPNENITDNIIREKIGKYGSKHLGLDSKTIKIVQNSSNELGQSIVNLIKKNYNNWNGHVESTSVSRNTTSSNTVAELRLCFEEIDLINPELNYYFRLYSKVEYPDNLIFSNEYEVDFQTRGWSKPIYIPFQEGFELKDRFNKWKARFAEKNVRLFIKGAVYNLSSWVEVKRVYPAAQMKALVKNEIAEKFEEWKPAFKNGKFKRLSIDHGLGDYRLYEFRNPQQSHPSLTQLEYESDIDIDLRGGLKLKPNTYLGSFLPNVLIEKGTGKETVIVENSNGISKTLQRKDTEIPLWDIPESFSYENKIKIKYNGEVKNKEIKLIEAEEYASPINRYYNTYTDQYGNTKILESIDYKSQKVEIDRHDINAIKPSIKPFNKKKDSISNSKREENRKDNALLNYITYKKKINFSDFFEAFEEILNRKFDNLFLEKLDQDISLLRRLSLRSYFNLGHIQIDYSNRKIVANLPQLILIPTKGGRKGLLIGGRSSTLLKKIKTESKKLGLHFKVTKSTISEKPELLLPDRITIIAKDIHAEKTQFRKLAKKCSLEYDPDKFFQLELTNKCSSLDEYFSSLSPWLNFSDDGYTAYIFDSNNLKFEGGNLNEINRNLSLVKYKVNNYKYRYVFWYQDKAFDVIPDWGRYLLLSKKNKQVVFRKKIDHSRGIFYVPGPTPLPLLLNKSLVLLSGKIPDEDYKVIRDVASPFKIYKNVPLRFADILFNKINQPVLPF